jgi:DNA-binding transcriptional regulator YiaG
MGSRMTPDQFRKLGEALYGPRWQSNMAHELGVADRTVRRWLVGRAIPAGVEDALRAICARRQQEIDQAMAALNGAQS